MCGADDWVGDVASEGGIGWDDILEFHSFFKDVEETNM